MVAQAECRPILTFGRIPPDHPATAASSKPYHLRYPTQPREGFSFSSSPRALSRKPCQKRNLEVRLGTGDANCKTLKQASIEEGQWNEKRKSPAMRRPQ
jgi:hypothetical protein